MAGRSRKLTPQDVEKIVETARSGASVATLAKAYGVTRPTIYAAINSHHEKAQIVRAGTASVSFTVDKKSLNAFDAFVGRLNLRSRADALRRVCRVPSGFLEPDEHLAEAVRDLSFQLKAIGTNVNQLVATKNFERRKGQKLKITADQEQLLSKLLQEIEQVSVQVRTLEGKRASASFQRYVASMKGQADE